MRSGSPSLARTGVTLSSRCLAWLTLALVAVWPVAGRATPGPDLTLSEVVELTLANDPNIAVVESRVGFLRGALQAASGRFDPLLSVDLDRSDIETPVSGGSSTETTTLSSTLQWTQLLRSGLSLEPRLDLTSTETGTTSNSATVAFTFRQPLMRDRGRKVVGAEELASQRELRAAELDLGHRISERVLAVVTLYWTLEAAKLDLEVLELTESSSRELLETTRRLIAADVTPPAEIVQLEADLASREASRIAAERSLFEARQNLGREIGLEPAQIAALPLPGEAFPVVEPDRVPAAETYGRWIERAALERLDLRAARERLEAAEHRLEAAENGIEPRLDVLFTPSYSGLDEDSDVGSFFTPLFSEVPGLSASLGLSLAWPLRNRVAEGALTQTQATVEQNSLEVEILRKSIGAEVPTALDAVRRNALQLDKIDQAVGYFERALENEIKKLRAGSSTLVDVISQRDRLTNVQRQQVSSRLAVAVSLLELRFTTGTMTEGGGKRSSISIDRLTTLPD